MSQLLVELRGSAEAALATGEYAVRGSAPWTPRSVLTELAGQSPVLARQLVDDRGTPRTAVKVLVDGVAPSLDAPLSASSKVKVISTLPCDG